MLVEEKIEKTVQWLRDKVEETKSKGLIVGVSGGIDSAVVAYLIKKACPDSSMGVIMSIKSSEADLVDGLKVVKGCGIDYLEFNLTEEQNLLLDKVKKALDAQGKLREDTLRMTDANLRARVRMSTVYTVANNLGYLVVGTDNSAEIYTGYFTKYGDGGVDILPIANISKAEVYEWGRVLGVPQSVLDREPSAGLWEGQTDETEMGTKYKYIDAVVAGRESEVPEEDRKVIERMHRVSQHKRETPAKPPVF